MSKPKVKVRTVKTLRITPTELAELLNLPAGMKITPFMSQSTGVCTELVLQWESEEEQELGL
jgi:hypothetical protein